MKCIGTPQHLKNSVGNLFSLVRYNLPSTTTSIFLQTIISSDSFSFLPSLQKINFTPANADAAECFVKENFPAAHKIHEYQGAMEFHIPQSIVSVSPSPSPLFILYLSHSNSGLGSIRQDGGCDQAQRKK